MVTFLHTADWHLGMSFPHLARRQEATQIRFITAENLIRRAASAQLDFALIAGDIFDHPQIEPVWIGQTIDLLLSVAPFPIYILPGNHDPLGRGSIYSDSRWQGLNNVTVLTEPRPVPLPGGAVLYPCPLFQKRHHRDPTTWIQADTTKISIGLAHGSLALERIEDPNFPIAPDRCAQAELDYLALGDWHSQLEHAEGRIAYPGTPEATKFGEKGCGHARVVTVAEPGAMPQVDIWETASLSWEEWNFDFTGDNLATFEQRLASYPHPEKLVLRLTAEGVVSPQGWEGLEELEREWQSKLFHLEVNRRLHLRPELAQLQTLCPQGAIFQHVLDGLQALMSRHASLSEFSSLSPDEAQTIFQELEGLPALPASEAALERAVLTLYRLGKGGES